MMSRGLLPLITLLAFIPDELEAAPLYDPTADLHFHAPDEIVPAVLPYLACLYASRGLPLLNGTEGQPIVSKIAVGASCSAVRRQAQKDSLALLGKRPADGRTPESIVTDILSSMDDYVDALAAHRSAVAGGSLSALSGSMVMIEDEALPAYTRYNDCLRARTTDSPVTAANVQRKFHRALELCREVRAAAIEEVVSALVDKGWDVPRRRKAAVNTFEKADESWSSLGQRLYRELLRGVTREAPARTKPLSA